MTRNIPVAVKKELRKEVGFCCPVPGCANPYLEWHHFDPPWHEEEHHRVEGMIALCREHHIQADNGAFRKEQLHKFKEQGLEKSKNQTVQGRFNWLRNDILAVVGSNFYHEPYVILEFRGERAIYFERDTEGYIRLNLRMLTKSGEPRASIKSNEWLNTEGAVDIECPPSGKRIKIEYPNGDAFSISFFEIDSKADMKKKYPLSSPDNWKITYPITIVEVTCCVGDSDIEFSPTKTKCGALDMRGCFISKSATAISLS